MHVPYSFKKDLELINPRYFASYDERSRTWSIRKWRTMYPRPHTMFKDSDPICMVPFATLDERMLEKIRRGLYWARKAKELAQSVDADNARLLEQSEAETEYVSRYLAKDIYRHYREPRIIGGVSGGDRPWKY